MKQIKLVIILLVGILGCQEKYSPKPRGFFRIGFPEKEYHILSSNYPYSFEFPKYAEITNDRHNPNEPYWINVVVPKNKAEIHVSYYNINSNKAELAKLMEETRRLAYKHTIKADAIEEQIFMNPADKVFGTIYRINGNAASPMQFFLTDSTNHFLRGAFYIREVPNIDSIQPVIDFFEPDVIRLIESLHWK